MRDFYIERNGVKLHIADREKIVSVMGADGPERCNRIGITDLYITNTLTFGDMATWCLGSATYDMAIPEGSGYAAGKHVWYYPLGSAMGEPYNVVNTFWMNIPDAIEAYTKAAMTTTQAAADQSWRCDCGLPTAE